MNPLARDITMSTKELKRFFSKIIIEQHTDCWAWTATKVHNGYGVFFFRGKNVLSHRLTYAWLVSPIKTRQDVHHTCNNKACCNPSHLQLISRRDHIYKSKNVGSVNGRKTHCANGHELTPDANGSRRCRICRQQKQREYNQLHKARLKLQAAERYAKNKEAICKKQRAYYHEHKDRIKLVQAEYRKNNPRTS